MQLTWLVGKQFLRASRRRDDWLVQFDGDSTLIIECLWRLIDGQQIHVTSIEHREESHTCVNRNGNEEIAMVFRDAGEEMIRQLNLSRIANASVQSITNDLDITFDNGRRLQLVSNRSNGGGWCFQSPTINLVAIGSSLSLHTKDIILTTAEQGDLSNEA